MKRGIDLDSIVHLGTRKPAARFGLHHRKGQIDAGMDADLTMISTGETTTASRETARFRHGYSPFENCEFSLRINRTLVRGQTVYHDESETGDVPTPGQRIDPLNHAGD